MNEFINGWMNTFKYLLVNKYATGFCNEIKEKKKEKRMKYKLRKKKIGKTSINEKKKM